MFDRRLFVGVGALVAVVAVVLGPAAAAGTSPVLGKKGVVRDGAGWGMAHPGLIFNGGDPSGRAWHLSWRNWGAATTYARGLTWIVKLAPPNSPPASGYYRKPGAIELRASRLGRCTPHGLRAYTSLRARVAVPPGGRLGHWFTWGGWKSTCKGP